MDILWCITAVLMVISALLNFTKMTTSKCSLIFFLDTLIIGSLLWMGPEIVGSGYLILLIGWSFFALLELLAFFMLFDKK